MANPLQNANHVLRHMKHPCHIGTSGLQTVNIMVEAAIAAGVPTLIAASTFSCMDILKTRAGISWKCGRALKANIEQAHGPKVVNKGLFYYEITGGALLERALWYYFLAELASEFAANWTTLMYSMEGCALGPHGTIAASAGPWDFLGGQGDARVLFSTGSSNACAAIGGHTALILPGCNGSVSFANGSGKCVAGQPQCSMQTSVVDASGAVYNSSNTNPPGGSADSNGNITFAQNLNGGAFGKEYEVKVQTDGGIDKCTQLRDGTLTISTQGRAVKPTPVGCTPKKTSNER